MSDDPMCPSPHVWWTYCHYCDLIRRVRAQASDWAVPVVVEAYEQGQRDMLAKCIAAVDGMVIDTVGNSAATVAQAVAALRVLEEKP